MLAAAPAVGQGTLSQQQAAELQRLLEERGAKLPELKSSPNVRWLFICRCRRSAARPNCCCCCVSALTAEPATQFPEACRLACPPSLPVAQQPQAREAAPRGGSELLGALKQQNQELQRVRQELEALKKAPSAPALSAPALSAPSPAAAPAPKPAAAPAAAEEEEGGGGAFAALNLVGILAAGGLYGYLTIQKKVAAEAEEAFQAKLTAGSWGCWAQRGLQGLPGAGPD